MSGHTCTHKLVAKVGAWLYYECGCGSRRAGHHLNSRVLPPSDTEWLAGADREPRENP